MKNQLTDRPLREVIEEAAREAAEEIRERNRRMGWPVITSDFLRKEKEAEKVGVKLPSDEDHRSSI